jgi:Oxygenase domain of the 2OGFeDO superfamily
VIDVHDFGNGGFELRREKSKRKQIKFLLLPGVISGAAWLKATVAARESHMNKGSRAADGQKYGRKLTLGWIKLRYPGYDNMRTAPTLEQPELLAAFYPLLREMDSLVQRAVPKYHDFAFSRAMTAIRPDDQHDDLSRITKERELNIVKALDPWDMTYTIRGTVFSTVEFNHNIVFKAHEDGSNVDGTCVCITTLDSYAGGRLVFPRYGYSAELGPRDLLLCDNNKELHGNLGPIVGDRFSVVAFLHDSVCNRASDAD